MCVDPVILPNGSEVACRKCWQCTENRINDWVGRCIAESRTAAVASFVTLTYGPDEYGNKDHVRAAVLTYSDVQKYFKRLRRDGYQFRYLVAGELGEAKGRTHWHAVIFWETHAPPHKMRQRHWDKYWTHGHQMWDDVTPKSVRYVCKYIVKDESNPTAQSICRMSKFPPIGAEYFKRLARKYVAQGLAPQNAFYGFPDIRDSKGRKRVFYLKGAVLDIFRAEFVRAWAEHRGGHEPASELIEEYLDKKATLEAEFQFSLAKHKQARPWLPAPFGAVKFSDAHNNWYCEQDGHRLWWSFGIGGERAWEEKIRTMEEGEAMRPPQRQPDGPTYRDWKGG
ncbi:replication initiator protein [Flyfo microvirus Tbat2_112]|nr:replication initiator protein [Flyfo microvirus Tbat2_112]